MQTANSERPCRRPSVLALALATTCTLAAAPALAQNPNDTAAKQELSELEKQSRALFEQARKLADEERWPEVCPILKAAHDLNSTGGTAYQLAQCYERIGKPEQALPLYEYILERRDANPEDRVKSAEERAAAIRAALPPPEPEPEPEPAAKPPPPNPEPPPKPLTKTIPPDRTAAYVALGIGGAGLVAGGIFGGLALSQKGSLASQCSNNLCPSEAKPDFDGANTKAWVANIGIGVGVVGVAVGVVLLATAKPKVITAIAPTANGVRVRF